MKPARKVIRYTSTVDQASELVYGRFPPNTATPRWNETVWRPIRAIIDPIKIGLKERIAECTKNDYL